jgi:hypothetical protein
VLLAGLLLLLGAAGVFLVLPASVHYGQEVRPYALALAFVAAADVALDAARRARRGAGVAHAVLAAAAAALALLGPLAPAVAAVVREGRPDWRTVARGAALRVNGREVLAADVGVSAPGWWGVHAYALGSARDLRFSSGASPP